MKDQKHIMTMLVDNQPGVLSRVVGLFSGKGFNIESLCVAPTWILRCQGLPLLQWQTRR
jgi:acetolactate synthase-1/3 small subunit